MSVNPTAESSRKTLPLDSHSVFSVLRIHTSIFILNIRFLKSRLLFRNLIFKINILP